MYIDNTFTLRVKASRALASREMSLDLITNTYGFPVPLASSNERSSALASTATDSKEPQGTWRVQEGWVSWFKSTWLSFRSVRKMSTSDDDDRLLAENWKESRFVRQVFVTNKFMNISSFFVKCLSQINS